MTTYKKDTGKYKSPVNYSEVFGVVSDISLRLINSCQYVYKDKKGTYVYEAVSYDGFGNVFFHKQYCKYEN